MNEVELNPEEVEVYAVRLLESARNLEALLARLNYAVNRAAEGWRDDSIVRVVGETDEIGKSMSVTFDHLDDLRRRIRAEIEWTREYQGIR